MTWLHRLPTQTFVHGLTSLLIASPDMAWPDRDRLIDATIETGFRADGVHH